MLAKKDVYYYLQAPLRLGDEIWRKEVRRNALKECLMPSGITYDQDKVQTSASDRMSEVMAKVGDLNREIAELQKKRAVAILEISQAIDKLDSEKEKTILDAYYIGQWSMQEIAEHQGYSLSHTYYLRQRGAEKLIGIII